MDTAPYPGGYLSHLGWKTDKTGKGIKLAGLFAKSEKEYLSRYYAPELLRPENLALLPAFHRFGWRCAKAFDALDSENVSAYVRELKAGLESARSQMPLPNI